MPVISDRRKAGKQWQDPRRDLLFGSVTTSVPATTSRSYGASPSRRGPSVRNARTHRHRTRAANDHRPQPRPLLSPQARIPCHAESSVLFAAAVSVIAANPVVL